MTETCKSSLQNSMTSISKKLLMRIHFESVNHTGKLSDTDQSDPNPNIGSLSKPDPNAYNEIIVNYLFYPNQNYEMNWVLIKMRTGSRYAK